MMKDEIRKLMHASPFVPFIIHTASGAAIPVPHPDFIAAGSDYPYVYVEEANGHVHRINVMLITSLEEAPPQQTA
jgi:hypothetical protein